MKTAGPARVRKRPYRMGARAEATAETRRSIADAWLAAFLEVPYDKITLDLVATRAGVSVQTVIRHFGSKDELFVAVARQIADEESPRRAQSPVDDVPTAVRELVSHYERVGDVILRLLAQEDRLDAMREFADKGRSAHYDWVERAFGPLAGGQDPGERRRRRAQLIAATDLYVWKVLRRDLGLGRRQTEIAIAEMVGALVDGDR